MKMKTKLAVLLPLLGVVIFVFLSWQIYVRRLDIFEASEKGYIGTIESLVNKKSGLVDAKRTGDKLTPLMLAALNGHEEVAKFLIDNGADVNALSLNLHTPLMFATLNGHVNICQNLIDNGADVNATSNTEGSPFTIAVGYAYEYGDSEIMEMMIAHGANVNKINSMGENLLHSLAWAKHPEIAELLTVRYGLDINAKNLNLRTPLWVASLTGNKEAVKVLIALGADVGAKDKYGETCLHATAQMGKAEAIEFLVSKGADINAKNNNGETPLDLALKEEHAKLAEVLRRYGGKRGR